MRTLLFALMLVCNISFGAEQIITGFEDKDVPVLNEELRKLSSDTGALTSTVNTLSSNLSKSGFGIVLSGDLSVALDVIPSRYYLPCGGTFTKVIAYAKTAPSGSSAIIDVNLNGTSIFNSGNITISSGSNSTTVASFSTSTFNADDYITVDVDQIGSSTAGADVVLSFYVTKDTA